MTALGHAIVFVSDMDRSVRFYRDVLGFSLRFDSPEWTEFDTGGTTQGDKVRGDKVTQAMRAAAFVERERSRRWGAA